MRAGIMLNKKINRALRKWLWYLFSSLLVLPWAASNQKIAQNSDVGIITSFAIDWGFACFGMSRGWHFRVSFCRECHFRQLTHLGLRHRASKYILLANTHKWYITDLPCSHHISTDLAVANLDIEALSVIKMSRSSPKRSFERPAFVAHQLCPPHLRRLVEDTVNSFDDKWLLPPIEGESFDTAKRCLARL